MCTLIYALFNNTYTNIHPQIQNNYAIASRWSRPVILKRFRGGNGERNGPMRVLSMPMSKAFTRFSRNRRTSRKLILPMLHEPSTRITMSATASVWHTNGSTVEGQRTRRLFSELWQMLISLFDFLRLTENWIVVDKIFFFPFKLGKKWGPESGEP